MSPRLTHRPRKPLSGLLIPALLSTLVLVTVVAGVAVGHFYWSELRTSMVLMDHSLETARLRQKQLVDDMSAAQTNMLAQQRHIQQTEERLRAREAALVTEQAALDDARRRLRLAAETQSILEEGARVRELVRRLDLALAGLSDPDGVQGATRVVDAVADWVPGSDLAADSELADALATTISAARAALSAADQASALELSEQIQRLGADAAKLVRSPAPVTFPPWGLGTDAARLNEQIETAAFALRRGDETLFRLALDTASAWLTAFYHSDRPEVMALQTRIAELRDLPIHQDLSAPRMALADLRAVLGELVVRSGANQDELESERIGSHTAPGWRDHWQEWCPRQDLNL